jgi:nicotinamidase-related amidase
LFEQDHQRTTEKNVKDWLGIVPEAERTVYEKGGFGQELTLGRNPVLLVIDVTYGFTGLKGQSLDDGVAMFGTACGPVAWEVIPRIAKLIGYFRSHDLPVLFTCGSAEDSRFAGRATKARGGNVREHELYNAFPDAVAPQTSEWVIHKTKASGFFQTPLASGLVKMGADCVLVCGVSTSGCVRASVVDSFSNGFQTFVVDDCCFDRSHFAHCANLFDMNAKYATAISGHEVEVQLGKLRS